MSDNLENDLFGGSDDGAPPQAPSPVASSSRGSPKQRSGSATPAVNNEAEDDGGIGADLFGDDDDDQPPSPRNREGTSPDTPVSPGSSRSPNPLEYAEEDGQDEPPTQHTWASIPFPKWDGLKPTDGKIWQMRLPAYVNMEPTPYDPVLYRAGLEPVPANEDQNAKRSKMISVRNTIRWKWATGDDGEPKRQSNSRLVRWSDGSVSLQLGSDLYDLAPSYGTTLARPTDPPSKNPLPEKTPGANATFLAIASAQEEVLMTENTIAGQLSLVPASSSSKTHIELVKHVGQQHVKHSRMKVMDGIVDPENAHVAAAAASAKKRIARGAGGGGGGGGGRARKLKRDSSDEDEDPRYTFDTDNPRRGTRAGVNEAEYDEDDGFVVADSDEDGEGEDEEDEEDGDGDYGRSKKSSKRRSKGKKRKGSVESLDEMEEMERRIEASEREKKRARKSKKEKSRRDYDTDEDEDEAAAVLPAADKDADGEEEEDMEMDIESEED